MRGAAFLLPLDQHTRRVLTWNAPRQEPCEQAPPNPARSGRKQR